MTRKQLYTLFFLVSISYMAFAMEPDYYDHYFDRNISWNDIDTVHIDTMIDPHSPIYKEIEEEYNTIMNLAQVSQITKQLQTQANPAKRQTTYDPEPSIQEEYSASKVTSIRKKNSKTNVKPQPKPAQTNRIPKSNIKTRTSKRKNIFYFSYDDFITNRTNNRKSNDRVVLANAKEKLKTHKHFIVHCSCNTNIKVSTAVHLSRHFERKHHSQKS